MNSEETKKIMAALESIGYAVENIGTDRDAFGKIITGAIVVKITRREKKEENK